MTQSFGQGSLSPEVYRSWRAIQDTRKWNATFFRRGARPDLVMVTQCEVEVSCKCGGRAVRVARIFRASAQLGDIEVSDVCQDCGWGDGRDMSRPDSHPSMDAVVYETESAVLEVYALE